MTYNVDVTGSVTASMVERSSVDVLVGSMTRFLIFFGLATCFVGVSVTCLLTMAGALKHPVPIYIGMTVSATAAVIFIVLSVIEWRNSTSARVALRDDSQTLNFKITSDAGPSGPTPTTGAP